MFTGGDTETDPDAPDGEKPTPLQDVALVDDHVSVDEAPTAMPSGLELRACQESTALTSEATEGAIV